jgi:YcaO-like protein with predicted kinase domain
VRRDEPAAMPSLGHLGLNLRSFNKEGYTPSLGGAKDPISTQIGYDKRERLLCIRCGEISNRSCSSVTRPGESCQGDTMKQPKEAPPELAWKKREKKFTTDGGHRSCLPEGLLQSYLHPIGCSGIIEELERAHRDPCGLVNVYVARLRSDLGGSSRRGWKGLRASFVGKGMTEAQARASALGEAVERYSAIFRGDEFRIKASYRELSSKAIHPNACMKFSASQYREREEWNKRETEFNWVPQPFDEERETEWTPVWSLTEGRVKYVATASCYFGYPFSAVHDFCRPDSNGNAAGANLEEAILKGFFEVVERDAVALWWYNRARRPRVELANFGEPYFQALGELYRILGRRMHVLDISADFPIPVFAAVSNGGKGEGDLLLGFGAHLDPRVAIARALTEMNQFLAETIAGETPCFFVGGPLEDAFLDPNPPSVVKTRADYAGFDNEDLRGDLRTCVELASERGLETLVLDQTRSVAGMHAVKVMVPEMRRWWARFAPGRLYNVPVEMGWQVVPLTEEKLNPCHLAV